MSIVRGTAPGNVHHPTKGVVVLHPKQSLLRFGIRIPVLINIPTALATQLASLGQPLPGPVRAVALLDTGADTTVVDEEIVRSKLQLQPVGQGQQHGVSGLSTTPVDFFACSIEVQMGSVVEVMEMPQTMTGKLSGMGLGALLGRDFLVDKMLIYDGDRGTWSLAK